MDFIFGILATDELKMVYHRANRRGIQHQFHISPLDPKPVEATTIRVVVGADIQVKEMACYYTVDGSLPQGSRGQASHGEASALTCVDMQWDTLIWGYTAIWEGAILGQPENTVVRYCISGWNTEGDEIYADWPSAIATAEKSAAAYFRSQPMPHNIRPGNSAEPTIFTYHVDRLTPPKWAYNAIIYQVFVDRFNPGKGNDWLQTDDLNGICGGTLWGVLEKLDYIQELGANCIWLSPTWEAPSHHGYDIIDYDHIAQRIGGEEALRALVDAAHQRGIRVLLDLACNHMSDKHPYFVDAQTNPTSPYRDWFIPDDSPHGYRAFFDIPSMPQINLTNPETRAWMLNLARHWIEEFDVDGYRLDYANGPGPEFWADFRAACRAAKPDALCFGEVIDSPDVLLNYIGRLDGCLDFLQTVALRNTFGYGTMTSEEFQTFIARHLAYYPDDFLMPTFIDNHDMDRFLYVAGGNKDALCNAIKAQMQLPGPPIIYYGTEIGLSQPASSRDEGMGQHVSRTPMIWDDRQDKALYRFYQDQIRQRQARYIHMTTPINTRPS